MFLEGRKKHQDKVKWLQRKHTSKNVPKKVLIKEEKEQWLNRIAAGKKVDVEHQIPIFGDIPEPPEKAKKVLSLPVKHKVADKVRVKGIKFEANVNNCKTRWGRRSSGSPEEQAEDLADNQTNILPTEDEYYWGIINENKEREIYDPESKTLDIGKLRCTDLRNNPRLHMPGPRPQREETMMQAKKEMYIEATKMYISKNCLKDGSQQEGGLDDEFKEGLEEIEEYKKTYNVVISTTDKSGKYTLNSRDSYKAQGDKHVSGDKEISWDDVTVIQNEVICHSKALCNVFKISNQWGEKEEARTRRAMAEKSTIIPQMVITQKDHKPIQDDGLPKTRAMCGASQSINQRVSDLLTDVLQALFSSELSNESLSTESYIHKIDKLNKDIREGRIVAPDLMVGSLDVEALYPSTDIYKAAEILKMRVIKSPMKFQNIDYRWALVYLALTMTPAMKEASVLKHVLPKRLAKSGSHPTIKTVHVDEQKERWSYPHPVDLLTSELKRIIVANVIEQMMIETFKTHVYEWEGKLYLQMAGGPIGLRSSGPVARILMDFWISELLEIAEKCNNKHTENPVNFGKFAILLATKYVDDVFVALERFKPGLRWDSISKALEWSEEASLKDKK